MVFLTSARPSKRLPMTLKALAPLVHLGAVFLAALIIFLISLSHMPLTQHLRAMILEGTIVVGRTLQAPLQSLRQAATDGTHLLTLRMDYARLEGKVAALETWQERARLAEAENIRLREQLQFAGPATAHTLTTELLSETHGPFLKTATIAVGMDNGVAEKMPVVQGRHLVGRVLEVSPKSARVLLITDPSCSIPVRLEHSAGRGIVRGDGAHGLTLSFLEGESTVEIGEYVLSSGEGGVFPEGYILGRVTSKTNAFITVEPHAANTTTRYVQVLFPKEAVE